MINQAFALAQQYHQAGSLTSAAATYRQILEWDPANARALFHLAAACEALGDLPGAIACYRRALRLTPDHAVVHYNLGVALKEQGELKEAVSCYLQAIELKPEFPEAYANLGIALHEQGDPERAMAAYHQALRLRPDFAEAHNNLGVILKEQRKLPEAAACYQRAVQLKPDYADAYSNLGNALRDQGSVEQAAAAYRQALSLEPGDAEAHDGLANVLEVQGRMDEAVRHALEALRLHPDWGRPLFSLAQLAVHGYYQFPEAQVERIETLVADPSISPGQAGILHFVLGVLYEKRAAYDDAFAHYRRGNALKHRLLHETGRAFDPQKHDEAIGQTIAAFDPAFFERVRGFGLDSELPVFIVGMPRSGTTLVEQILASHPQMFGAGELTGGNRLADELTARLGAPEGYPRCLDRLDAATARATAGDYAHQLAWRGGEAARVSDKGPLNYLYLGLLAALYPRARVIHCRRDPRGVCLSCYFQYFREDMDFTWDLGDLGRYYRAYERLMDHWRAVLPLRTLDVVYEDLATHQEAVSRQLVAFCGLDWDQRCLAFHENRRPVQTASKLQVRKPMYTTSIGRWRHYAAHLGPLLEALGLR
jgi:tetratricopeptide (TPR) repeat protein